MIQYVTATDRMNSEVSYLYDSLNPAVLRLIKYIIDSGHAKGISVRMCGEMAGNPLYTWLLVGLKIDELSMNATSLLAVKEKIRNCNLAEAEQIAAKIQRQKDPAATKKLIAAD